MIHAVKIEKKYFEKQAAGEKPWELRRNDRDYKVGDYLALNEVETKEQECIDSTKQKECIYTGRSILVKIVDVFENANYLTPGYVLLTTEPCFISDAGERKTDAHMLETRRTFRPSILPGKGGNCCADGQL